MRATTQNEIGGVLNLRPLLPIFLLQGKSIASGSSIGTVIGVFHHSSNYVLTSDPSGQFAIDGDALEVDDTLTPGTYTITVTADAGAQDFSIRVF